jgi:hypothetical protein
VPESLAQRLLAPVDAKASRAVSGTSTWRKGLSDTAMTKWRGITFTVA